MSAYSLRTRGPEDVLALRKLRRATGEATRSKAIWKAIYNYPDTCRDRDQLRERLSEAERELARIRVALSEVGRTMVELARAHEHGETRSGSGQQDKSRDRHP